MSGLRELRTVERPRLRRRALQALERAFQWSSAGAAYVHFAKARGAVILMYHSVPLADAAPWIDPRNAIEPRTFRQQMAFLAANRRVVSLAQLADALTAGEAPSSGTVVLTFDDGYRDTLDVAAPILAELSLPATLFLPTSYIADGETQWVDRLYGAFRARTRERLEVSVGGMTGSWRLEDDAASRSAYESLCALLMVASRDERTRALDEIDEQLAPAAKPPSLTLDWDGVRSLIARFPLFEIGGHTVGHTSLERRDADVCRAEIRGCADAIERETGRRPAYFSFPYGRSSAPARRIVAECGFRAAVADGEDVLIRPGHDLYALPRIEAPASPANFRFRTSGAYPGLPRRLLGRA